MCGSQWYLEKASSYTPHIPSDTPVPDPLGQVPPFSPYSKFSAQGREHVSCLSLSGQDKVGKGVFPGPQQSGSGQPPLADVATGL